MAYTRYSRGMSYGGHIESKDGNALTLEAIQAEVPAVFACTAHDSRTERFVPITTAKILEGLAKEGFDPFMARQIKTRDQSRRDYTKHMVRLRHRDATTMNGTAFEIILINGNDGSAGFNLFAGGFRFVCCNGLLLGDIAETVKVRHSGRPERVRDAVIEGAYRVLDAKDAAESQIDRLRSIALNPSERLAMGVMAHRRRFPQAWDENRQLIPHAAPVGPEAMIAPQRVEDTGSDLWTTFNVAQENTVRVQHSGHVASDTHRSGFRRQTTSPITGINQNVKINRGLMQDAMALADLIAA